MRIIVDRDLCEGNATCVAEAPEVFTVDEEGRMVLVHETPGDDHASLVRKAVHRCPRGALSLAED